MNRNSSGDVTIYPIMVLAKGIGAVVAVEYIIGTTAYIRAWIQ